MSRGAGRGNVIVDNFPEVQGCKIVDATTGLSAQVSARAQTPTGNVLQVQIGPGDVISNIPVFMPYDHHQVHEGEMWHYDAYISNLASESSYDFVFTVPVITPVGTESIVVRCPHFRYIVETNDLCNVFFYEAPTVTAATGTAKTPINFERNGNYTPKLAILEAPTITVVGTQIDAEYFIKAGVGATSGGGEANAVNEFILKSNTMYLFRVTSGAAGCDIHVDFHWYEDLGV
jgi:hypothetical protein